MKNLIDNFYNNKTIYNLIKLILKTILDYIILFFVVLAIKFNYIISKLLNILSLFNNNIKLHLENELNKIKIKLKLLIFELENWDWNNKKDIYKENIRLYFKEHGSILIIGIILILTIMLLDYVKPQDLKNNFKNINKYNFENNENNFKKKNSYKSSSSFNINFKNKIKLFGGADEANNSVKTTNNKKDKESENKKQDKKNEDKKEDKKDKQREGKDGKINKRQKNGQGNSFTSGLGKGLKFGADGIMKPFKMILTFLMYLGIIILIIISPIFIYLVIVYLIIKK